jgi:hypothetical protein
MLDRKCQLGRRCQRLASWASLDKGVLELLGPSGISQKVTGWLVPSVQKMQTGAVHAYFLKLNFCIFLLFKRKSKEKAKKNMVFVLLRPKRQ